MLDSGAYRYGIASIEESINCTLVSHVVCHPSSDRLASERLHPRYFILQPEGDRPVLANGRKLRSILAGRDSAGRVRNVHYAAAGLLVSTYRIRILPENDQVRTKDTAGGAPSSGKYHVNPKYAFSVTAATTILYVSAWLY